MGKEGGEGGNTRELEPDFPKYDENEKETTTQMPTTSTLESKSIEEI